MYTLDDARADCAIDEALRADTCIDCGASGTDPEVGPLNYDTALCRVCGACELCGDPGVGLNDIHQCGECVDQRITSRFYGD